MDNKYREDFAIPSYLADGSRELSPNATLLVFQELAYRGANDLSFGDSVMKEKGLAWVLSRMHFVTYRAPVMGERVKLETWHKGLDGLFYLRDYRILDTDGRELTVATSSFVIIDTRTREMVRTDSLGDLVPPEPQCGEHAIQAPADRLAVRGDDFETSPRTRRVEYSDTDFVEHVNNSNYLKWMLDYEYARGGVRKAKDVCINFSRETHLGSETGIRRFERPDGVYLQVVSEGVASATARLQF